MSNRRHLDDVEITEPGSDQNSAQDSDQIAVQKIMQYLLELSLGRWKQVNSDLDFPDASQMVREIAQYINKITDDIVEAFNFASDLANGQLDTPVPSRRNYLAGSLKALQSQLLHLTWQAQRVQEGDFSQSVDFMGDFSEAFNGMIRALDERTRRLNEEIQTSKKAREALVRSQKDLEIVLENLSEIIVVVAEGKVVFKNAAANLEFDRKSSQSSQSFFHEIQIRTAQDRNIEDYYYYDKSSERWFQIKSIPIEWLDQKEAFLQVAFDVSALKAREERLNELANTDDLTQVASRRSGLASFNELLSNPQNFPISICVLDLDRLKYVNDEYGHVDGDYFIRSVARAITESIRQGDVVCRMGGDEFLIIFVKENYAQTQQVMERIHTRLLQISAESGKEFPMDFSYGIEEINYPNIREAEEYLPYADKRMYENKAAKKKAQGHNL